MNISVVLCTFNGEPYLARQLCSLAQQRRKPDELLIYDDLSTDNTVQIIQQFAASAPFPVRWRINPSHFGVCGNFQSAISDATGDIIACCDQDDVWYPEKLSVIESAFAAGPTDLVFSDADLVDQDLRPMAVRLWQTVGFYPRKLTGRLWQILVRFNVVTGTTMAFASKWKDLLLPIPGTWLHDGWIAMVLSIVGHSRAIEQPLMAYRHHADQQIGPGPMTLSDKIEKARQMDLAYFLNLQRNFTELMNRLSRTAIDPAISRLVWDKLVHCRNRAAMREDGSSRTKLISTELLSGRYGSCALGWKSLAQDLFLQARGAPPRSSPKFLTG